VKPPKVDDWLDWAATANIQPEIMAFAKLRPQVIFGKPDTSANDVAYCTPRSVHALSDVSHRWPGGLPEMVKTPQGMAVITGFIGKGAAAELHGVVNLAVNLPSYEQVVADPVNTAVPKKPDECYASLMMVAMRAQLPDADKIVQYLTRFDPNFSVVGLAALIRRDTQFSQTQGIGNWVRSNKDLVQKLSRHIRVRK
jgi:hypothetical protein